MNIFTVPFDGLSDSEFEVWDRIQRGNPTLASPYFRPEFARAVNAARQDVEVAVLRENGRPVGFLPFHRTAWNSGRPLGCKLSDVHAVIRSPGTPVDLSEVVRAAGLRSWTFEKLLSTHSSAEPFVRREDQSPYIDLSEGFEAYIDGRENGKRLLKTHRKKVRNLERAVGPLRFDPHVPDLEVVETCLRWKADQYRRSNVPNVLKSKWVVDLLKTIAQMESNDFSALVAVLYAGDRIAAIDVGMRSRDVWHPWFCAFDRELQAHSPGIVHLIEMMRAAPELGIRRIDLGTGGEEYKNRFESGVIHVSSGAIDVPAAVAAGRRVWWHLSDAIRRSPLIALARVPRRMLRRASNQVGFG